MLKVAGEKMFSVPWLTECMEKLTHLSLTDPPGANGERRSEQIFIDRQYVHLLGSVKCKF